MRPRSLRRSTALSLAALLLASVAPFGAIGVAAADTRAAPVELTPSPLAPATSPCPFTYELSPACQPGSRCAAVLRESCRDPDDNKGIGSAGGAGAATPASASWQTAVIGGLAGFVADRAKAEVVAWAKDLITAKLCRLTYTELDARTGVARAKAPATRWFPATCVLLEDREYSRQIGSRLLAGAVRADLASLPRAVLHHWLGSRAGATALSNRRLLVAYELVWSGVAEARAGAAPLELVAGLGRNSALIELCRAQNPADARAAARPFAPECLLVVAGLIVEAYGQPVLGAGKVSGLANPDAVLAQVLRLPTLAGRVAIVYDEARGKATYTRIRETSLALEQVANTLAQLMADVRSFAAAMDEAITALDELAPTLAANSRKALLEVIGLARRVAHDARGLVQARLDDTPARLATLRADARALAERVAALTGPEAAAVRATLPELPLSLGTLDLAQELARLTGARGALDAAFAELADTIPAAWRPYFDLDRLLDGSDPEVAAAKARLVRLLRAIRTLDGKIHRLGERSGAPGPEQALAMLTAIEELVGAGFALVPEHAAPEVHAAVDDGLATTHTLIELAGAILLEDHARAAGHLVAVCAELGIPVPAAARRFLAFLVDVASARDSDDVQRALESVAAPLGGWRLKRERLTLSVTAFAGAMAGREYPDTAPLAGQATVVPRGGWAAGLFAPVGVDLSWPTAWGWSQGFFVSILDVGQLTWARLSDVSAADGSPEVAAETDFTQVFSPGVYFHVSLGDSPFTLAAGASYAPALRRYRAGTGDAVASDDELAPLSTWRLGLSLAVDVTILPLWVRSGAP